MNVYNVAPVIIPAVAARGRAKDLRLGGCKRIFPTKFRTKEGKMKRKLAFVAGKNRKFLIVGRCTLPHTHLLARLLGAAGHANMDQTCRNNELIIESDAAPAMQNDARVQNLSTINGKQLYYNIMNKHYFLKYLAAIWTGFIAPAPAVGAANVLTFLRFYGRVNQTRFQNQHITHAIAPVANIQWPATIAGGPPAN